MRWLEQFKSCFGHRAQLLALRMYVQGVFSDSERKSMQAMLARVTEPVTYQAFQHFITHAPWEARRSGGVAGGDSGTARCLDSRRHQFSETGSPSVGVVASVLWRARQDRELPSRDHRRVVDGGARWFLGAQLYLPEEWLTPAHGSAHGFRPASVSGEMAPRADAAAAGARRGLYGHGGPRRCGIWRCLGVSRRPASPPVAVCVGDFVDIWPCSGAARACGPRAPHAAVVPRPAPAHD